MSSRSDKARRTRLFKRQNGICFWCDKPTVLLDPYPTKLLKIAENFDLATLEHLDDRLGIRRRVDLEERTVMACMFCNLLGAVLSHRLVQFDPSRKPSGKRGVTREAAKKQPALRKIYSTQTDESLSTLADIWPKHDEIAST